MNNWIVFQFVDPKSDDCGIIALTSTHHDSTFTLQKNHKIKVLAEGFSFEKATSRTALTPEICHLTKAIGTIFGQQNNLESKGLDNRYIHIIYFLFDAYKKIIDDRQVRNKHNYFPMQKYLDVFVDPYAGNTGKYLIYRKLSSLFETKPDGTIVDLKEAVLTLVRELTAVALENQIIAWRKEEAKSKRTK